jgi:hypothetical protein
MPLRNLKSKIRKNSTEEFEKLKENLRNNIFPYMPDDELYKFMQLLQKWTHEMLD